MSSFTRRIQIRGKNVGVRNPQGAELLARERREKRQPSKPPKPKKRREEMGKPKPVIRTSSRVIDRQRCKRLDSGTSKAQRREQHKARMEAKASARIVNYHSASTPQRALGLFKYFGLASVRHHEGRREKARRVRQMEAVQ